MGRTTTALIHEEIGMKKKTFQATTCLTACLATGLMFSQTSIAGIKGIRSGSVSGGMSGQTTSNVIVVPGKMINETVIKKEATGSATCSHDTDSATYFPLSFFQNISRDGSSLIFEKRPDNKILVRVPAILNSCGRFKVEHYQDPITKSVTIFMKLEDGKTYSQYLTCLEQKKILHDGQIDHDSIPGKEYSEYSYELDYSFSKDKDIKKTAKISFGTPVGFLDTVGKDIYPPAYKVDMEETSKVIGPLCMKAEMIQSEMTYINEGQDILLEKMKTACQSNDSQKIAEAKRSLGNADALKDVFDKVKEALDASYLLAIKNDKENGVPKILANMQKIEDQFLGEAKTMDEATARKLSKKYADLAKELNSKFIDPSIDRLNSLMKKREDMDSDDPKRDVIDKEIKGLNADIGEFGKREIRAKVYDTVMEKYAIVDSAKVIEDIRLKSILYSNVYAGPAEGRAKALTFQEANQKQFNGMKIFEKALIDWNDLYLAGKGNTAPLQKTEKERTAAIDRMNKRWVDFQTNEQKKYQKYCGIGMTGYPSNPVQCQAFSASAKSRLDSELNRRTKDLQYISGRERKLGKMSANYGEYQKREVAADNQQTEIDLYGSSYELDPSYYNTQAASPYGQFSGAEYGQMRGGGLNYPGMVNPQMPVQPGQYAGQMQSGWPGIN